MGDSQNLSSRERAALRAMVRGRMPDQLVGEAWRRDLTRKRYFFQGHFFQDGKMEKMPPGPRD